jgi:Fanconi-associated nuclease 1
LISGINWIMRPNICEKGMLHSSIRLLNMGRYVRLFLRKTAAWHRIQNIGYQSDISNINLAVGNLQASRRAQYPLDLADVRQTSECAQKIVSRSEVRTFHFADTSDDQINTLEEASSLLSLEELKGFAKDAKVKGKNKAELLKNLRQMSNRQSGLSWNISRRHDDQKSFTTGKLAPIQDRLEPSLSPFATSIEKVSAGDSSIKHSNHPPERYASLKDQEGNGFENSPDAPTFRDNNRDKLFVSKILGSIGPCIRLNLATAKLFERVHLVYYRSTEWTAGSLVTIILARIQRQNFPQYIVSRSKDIFPSRSFLIEFEAAIKLQFEADNILENGTIDQKGLERVLEMFEIIYPKWKILIHEEQAKEDGLYDSGEGAYLRRFSPGWIYTRIVHKATYAMGRLKQYEREHQVLSELLDQRLFHPARRGGWHQRKALLEEHYMAEVRAGPSTVRADLDKQRRYWKQVALGTCEKGLQDRDCHLIYHYDLQKRIKKLEKVLRIAKREQHDFGHISLTEPVKRVVEGIRIQKEISGASISHMNEKRRGAKTIWLDETEGGGECTVEDMCLSWYREQGWKGEHFKSSPSRPLSHRPLESFPHIALAFTELGP